MHMIEYLEKETLYNIVLLFWWYLLIFFLKKNGYIFEPRSEETTSHYIKTANKRLADSHAIEMDSYILKKPKNILACLAFNSQELLHETDLESSVRIILLQLLFQMLDSLIVL